MEPSGDEFQAVCALSAATALSCAAAKPVSPPARLCADRAILSLLAVVAARLDRVETRKISGDAIVNDGDSITLKGERIRLRGIDAPEYNQTCRKDGATYPCGRRSREALVRARQERRDRMRGLGARPLRPPAWRLHGRRRRSQPAAGGGGLGGCLWRLCRRRADRRAQRGAGLWAGSFERPRDWRVEHGGMVESEHDLFARMVNWLQAIFGFS